MSDANNDTFLPSQCQVPSIPKALQVRGVAERLLEYREAQQLRGYRRAAHACIWARQPGTSNFGELRAAVMMHLRFDGMLGFPGGLLEDGEDEVEGLNRELEEEIGWSTKTHAVTWDHYCCTAVAANKWLVLHFFVMEIPLQHYQQLERNCLAATEYGNEVFGTVRVPLYTMANGYHGLPAFLNNKFVGSAKQQLILALYKSKIMTEEELGAALYQASRN